MNLEQLKIFVEAARHGSFTLAASGLGLTQSAISISIRKLEERHEVVLFNRVGNGLSLTEPGRILLTEAERILADVELTIRRIETYRNAPKRRLLVACSRNAYDHWMPAIQAHMLESTDLPQLELAVGKSDDITAWVMRGTVDFGLTEVVPGHSTLRYWEVFEDRMRLYTGAGVRLQPDASWQALDEIGPILWESGGDLESFVIAAIESNNLHERRLRHPALRFQTVSAVCAALRTGKHAGYVPERVASSVSGFDRLTAWPAFDIPIRYWLFGSQHGWGEILANGIRMKAVELQDQASK